MENGTFNNRNFSNRFFSLSNIRYLLPYTPYLLNYLFIWVKTVTYVYEP